MTGKNIKAAKKRVLNSNNQEYWRPFNVTGEAEQAMMTPREKRAAKKAEEAKKQAKSNDKKEQNQLINTENPEIVKDPPTEEPKKRDFDLPTDLREEVAAKKAEIAAELEDGPATTNDPEPSETPAPEEASKAMQTYLEITASTKEVSNILTNEEIELSASEVYDDLHDQVIEVGADDDSLPGKIKHAFEEFKALGDQDEDPTEDNETEDPTAKTTAPRGFGKQLMNDDEWIDTYKAAIDAEKGVGDELLIPDFNDAEPTKRDGEHQSSPVDWKEVIEAFSPDADSEDDSEEAIPGFSDIDEALDKLRAAGDTYDHDVSEEERATPKKNSNKDSEDNSEDDTAISGVGLAIMVLVIVLLTVVCCSAMIWKLEKSVPDEPKPAYTIYQTHAKNILSSMSYGDHGDTLSAYCDEIRRCDFWAYGFFDEYGNKLVEYNYRDPYWVSVPEGIYGYLAEFGNITMVISHPLLQTGFLDTDLSLPVRKGLQNHIRAIYVLDARYIYTLEMTAEGHWPQSNEVSDQLKSLKADPEFTGSVYHCVDQGNFSQEYPTSKTIWKMADYFGLEYDVLKLNSENLAKVTTPLT